MMCGADKTEPECRCKEDTPNEKAHWCTETLAQMLFEIRLNTE